MGTMWSMRFWEWFTVLVFVGMVVTVVAVIAVDALVVRGQNRTGGRARRAVERLAMAPLSHRSTTRRHHLAHF